MASSTNASTDLTSETYIFRNIADVLRAKSNNDPQRFQALLNAFTRFYLERLWATEDELREIKEKQILLDRRIMVEKIWATEDEIREIKEKQILLDRRLMVERLRGSSPLSP